MVPGPLATFLAARQELIAGVEPGTTAARALSRLSDGAIRSLAEPVLVSAGTPVAIFATGGWGAQRLLPRSDLDLLLITKAARPALEPLVRALLYPLWDAGFAVGHQVRTPKEHASALFGDIDNLTTFLSARHIAGDERLAAHVSRDAFRRIRRRAQQTVAAISGRRRPGSPYLLEPDLKEGAGGQRDIDELVWCASVLSGRSASNAEPLAELGLLTTAELCAVERAQQAITAARWRLHAHAARATNTMTLDDAEAFGIDASAVQNALAVCHNLLLDVRDRLAGAEPSSPHQLGVEDLAEYARAGLAGVGDLERAAWTGRLENAAPGFRDLMVLRRPALTHRYTVGAHSVRALALLRDAEPGVLPLDLAAPHAPALLAATISHDVGKRTTGDDHAVRGSAEARAIARRLGLLPEEAEVAARLVAEHLLMPQVSATGDLNDENAVLAAAARVGDRDLVAPLYQLAVADMRATGPDVWTPWRAIRMGELATKIEAALSPEVDGAGIVASAEATRTEALRRASSVGASRSVLGFLEQAPLRYLATRDADAILRDARLVQSLTGPGGAREMAFAVRPGPAPGSHLLEVVTRDRRGLFATIAGAIELAGLSVLAAEAFTSTSGVAIDSFTVTSATHAAVTASTWEAFEGHLRSALNDHATLAERLRERRTHYEHPGPRRGPARVRAGQKGSFGTTITVRASDRVGLLYDLARVLETAELDIRRAVITTMASQADDTFEVTDDEGMPPDPVTLARLVVPALKGAALGPPLRM